MKLRVGACALMMVLAGCSGESPESGMAGMRGVAASKATGSLPTSLPLARAIGASIANAPDRGALLSFPNKATPAKQEGAYTWFPTAISEAHAFKAVATGEMTVPSPDGSQVKLRYERHAEEIDGNWTWIGRVVGGDPMQEAIITFGEKAVFGSIPQANGKPALSLQTRNGTVFAVQTDPSKVVSATKGHEDVMIPEAATLRSSMGAAVSQSAQVSQGATAVAQAAPPTAANTIDVAIGYTPEFAAANGGASGAATRLVFLVQIGNQAFANSDVNGYLRIVHALQVSYTNTNTNQTALQELTGSTGNSPVTVPASLAPLRTARDQYGADIAVLVRKFNTPENEGCGIAWLNGANQTAITSADAAWGYAVISDGYDTGTDGKTYYCADETLVHEAAHLMGSAHDRSNSTTTGGALQYGRFPYSFGYKTASAAGNFYTVMAYGDTGQIAHRIFSTPLKSTCGAAGNLTCGVANSEDNARSLNQVIPVVAGFRGTVVPFGNPMNLVYIAKRGGSSRVELHTLTASSVFQTFSSHIATGLAMGTADKAANYLLGDYNGDGVSDLYFVMKSGTASNKTEVHVLSGPSYSSFSLHAATPYGAIGSNNRWISRLADYNGDSKPDLYLIDKAGVGGRVSVYILSGATSFQTELLARTTITGTLPTGTEWVVDVGDFNGDAVPDIFLIGKNGAGGRTEVHILNGATQYQSYLRNIATALGSTGTDNRWDFKIGDYDRDGIQDIYALDKGSSSGRTDVHVLSGQTSYQTFLLQASMAVGAVGTGFESEFELVPGSN
ncbi:FG-GAP-like repeat-containing protein [Pseudoxanthomonas sp. LH2527]|uniref:reprolysin-like metallopeptidase n=1 Tax=Pseudoxanthomonas sp. LH2527 TaxID=2923249 RepID=UPI001F13FE3B|nr:FG-GAP-like repeat-containing protein [Pseudoxanthomonas sp. LH2527]MCH6482365.1 FG-GAP-like repeat-containing protein [Pseudoxanthomonas sp. LH2527]